MSDNHPLAARMAAIAFLSYNLTIGCIFGSYSVMMGPIEVKLGLTRDVSSLGIPLILLAIALSAPVVGILVGKVSIRLLMMLGALLPGRWLCNFGCCRQTPRSFWGSTDCCSVRVCACWARCFLRPS